MTRRRNVILTAGLALTLVPLAACDASGGGSTGGSGDGQCSQLGVAEIIVADHPEEQRQWQQDVATRFEEQTGVALSFQTMGNTSEEQQLIQTSVVSGSGPDVFRLGTTWVPVAYATGEFEVLSAEDWEAVGGQDRFVPETLGMSGPSEDERIGVPFTMNPFGLVYNTEMFEEAGLDGPPETWDEFVQDAQTIHDELDMPATAIDYASSFGPWKYLWMFTRQNGGDFVSEDLSTAELDSEEVFTAVTDYFDLLTEHDFMDPDSVTMEGPQVAAAFANGDIAMAANATPTWVPTLEDSPVADSYQFVANPTVPFGHSSLPEGAVPAGTIVAGDDLVIASYSDCRDAALQYMEFVTSPEEQQNIYDIFGSPPTNQEAAEQIAQDSPQMQGFLDAAATGVPTAFTGSWANVQNGIADVVTQSLSELAQGSYDPDAVRARLAEANETVQRGLDRAQSADN